MFMIDLKKLVVAVQDDMINVSICIPAFLPLDRNENTYNFIKSLEDKIDEQVELLEWIENYEDVIPEELQIWQEFSSIVNVYISAAKQENVLSLHKEYSEFLESNKDENIADSLLFMKVKIYDTFIDNVAELSKAQEVA